MASWVASLWADFRAEDCKMRRSDEKTHLKFKTEEHGNERVAEKVALRKCKSIYLSIHPSILSIHKWWCQFFSCTYLVRNHQEGELTSMRCNRNILCWCHAWMYLLFFCSVHTTSRQFPTSPTVPSARSGSENWEIKHRASVTLPPVERCCELFILSLFFVALVWMLGTKYKMSHWELCKIPEWVFADRLIRCCCSFGNSGD